MIQNNKSDWNYYCFKNSVKVHTTPENREISKEEEDYLLDHNNWVFNKNISKPTESNETKRDDATLGITAVGLALGAIVLWLLNLP